MDTTDLLLLIGSGEGVPAGALLDTPALDPIKDTNGNIILEAP